MCGGKRVRGGTAAVWSRHTEYDDGTVLPLLVVGECSLPFDYSSTAWRRLGPLVFVCCCRPLACIVNGIKSWQSVTVHARLIKHA